MCRVGEGLAVREVGPRLQTAARPVDVAARWNGPAPAGCCCSTSTTAVARGELSREVNAELSPLAHVKSRGPTGAEAQAVARGKGCDVSESGPSRGHWGSAGPGRLSNV